jgi:alpha-tubulin suppressor-like RCC1 family protein
MVRIGLVVVFLCWFVVAPLSAQTSLFSPDGWFDSRWNEQTDNVGVTASHGLTLVHKADGSVQIWGRNYLPVPALPPGMQYTSGDVGLSSHALVRSDGLILAGPSANVPPLPAGVGYTQVAISFTFMAALRSDGQIVAWGGNQFGQLNVPPLPAGVVYVELAVGRGFYGYGMARRSDGAVVVWGQNAPAPVPALPTGVSYTGISAGYSHATAVRSDGELVAWGSNVWGQAAVPPLPAGRRYEQVAAAERHTLARRDDGVVVAFGTNDSGQCDVPPLPPGTIYVDIAAGGGEVVTVNPVHHSVALRSDGKVIAWGDNSAFQCGAPSLPPGVDYVGLAGGDGSQVLLRSDGAAIGFGITANGALDIPPLPAGVTYVEVEANLARRSDGQVVAWGWFQQAHTVPPLPPGRTYVEVAAGGTHALARRSDGVVVAWGQNDQGQCFVPALPPNRTYVAIAAGGNNSMALRSDGVVLVWGDNSKGQCSVPWQLATRDCVEIATVGPVCFARSSDGEILTWGDPNGGLDVPGLPFGVSYVGVSGRFARRSDGSLAQLRTWGTWTPVPPGSACNEVQDFSAILGPPSSYVSFASGCSGSLPPARLVPRDTPRIGETLVVALFDLPADLALVFTGLSTSWSGTVPLPIALGPFGMPGCTAFVSPDHLLLLAGANQQATLHFAIPNQPALVGARFHQQAFVPDAGAGNPLLGVVSNAATAIVGH